jgi:hypothetical protein
MTYVVPYNLQQDCCVTSPPTGKCVYRAIAYKRVAVVPPLLSADDKENTASSIVACWTVFTELLPGNALMRSINSILNCFPVQTWQSNGTGNKRTCVWCILGCQNIRLCRFTLIPLVDGYVIGIDTDSTCRVTLFHKLSRHSISSDHHVVIFHFSKNILQWTYHIFLTSLHCHHAGITESLWYGLQVQVHKNCSVNVFNIDVW